MIRRIVSHRTKILVWISMLLFTGTALATWQSYKTEAKNLNFSCIAKTFEVGSDFSSELLLEISSIGQLVTLDYQSTTEGGVENRVKLSGHFKKMDVNNMGYQLQLDGAEIDSDEEWPMPELAEIINFAKETLESGESTLLNIRLVAMEIDKGYAVLQFCPGNSLWVCNIN